MRATAGLPPPLNPGKGSALRFSAEAVEEWLRDHPRIARAKLLEAIPLGRTGTARDVATIPNTPRDLAPADRRELLDLRLQQRRLRRPRRDAVDVDVVAGVLARQAFRKRD